MSVEVSKKHVYTGGAEYKSIDSYLKLKGYKKIAEWVDPKIGHGDALYVAKGVSVGIKSRLIGKYICLFHVLYLLLRALDRRNIVKLTVL